MARTVLRSRSGDIVTAVQLADRTGIVAASAPPAADEPESPVELDLSAPCEPEPSMLVASTEPRVRTARRVRRNLLFSCAAAVFLAVGWIGGGVWGHHQQGPDPVLAVGSAVDQGQGGAEASRPARVAPAPETPAPTAAPVTPSTKPVTPAKRTTKARPETKTPAARSDTGSAAPTSAAPDPMQVMSDQLEQLVVPWSRALMQGHGTYQYRSYGR
ncbi:hypothetical protein [Amycolatopsis alkalitolerans]|uniref:Uncharacterized protein n=1 Tax=Amycolatopsis alkalitolerans TaxID=2547244 RepID=A0A5C4LTY5_9PSEU|nr:hypothetical protein [Amycolatopsis alkalitolerans]TNC20873.1 hypothetical protein FG385_29740 [Amycolatopsis alkalitolerans]